MKDNQMLSDKTVGISFDMNMVYSNCPPYDPSEAYPEFPELNVSRCDNPAFRLVRRVFINLGFDKLNLGSINWNPLIDIVKPGDTVVLKPNFVTHYNHGNKLYGITDMACLITHGSVIRAVLEYVAKALKGNGKVIIGDCPIQGTDWNELLRVTNIESVVESVVKRYPGLKIYIKDYRLGLAIIHSGQILARVSSSNSPSDYTEVDLGVQSELIPLINKGVEFGVTHYPRYRMRAAHTPTTNRYLIPNDILYSNVLINLPKMKNHQKAGITCALKNLVGINGHKDYLPHFRFGSPKKGGDEYPDGGILWDLMWYFAHKDWDLEAGLKKRFYNLLRRFLAGIMVGLLGYSRDFTTVGGGGWAGNDTLWRTILDINRAFFYFNRKNKYLDSKVDASIRYFSILDGIIAGEGESPLSSSPKPMGVIMAAKNPVALDCIATALMGFDYKKLKQIERAFAEHPLPLAFFGPNEIEVISDDGIKTLSDIQSIGFKNPFRPSVGYRGWIELE